MKSVHTHRFQLIGLASLVCGVLGMVAVWSATGFPPPGQVNLNRITLGLAAGALVPLGLSLCNVIWKDRLYQNLPLLAALAFNLLFDLAFLMVLGAATLWAMGIVSEFWQLGTILERADVLAGLGTAAALLFLHHYTSLIGLIVGKGQLGLHLLGRRRFPHVLERFVLVVELVDPPATVMDRNSPRYLGYLNDFYQDLEECARLHGAELASFTARGALLCWPETKGSANNQAIGLVSDLRELISRHETWYLVVYHCIPRFRAALDFGSVVSAEMGWHRKTIVTQGATVESAKRLLQTGTRIKEDFCIGEAAMDRLILPAGSRIHRNVNGCYALEQLVR